MDIAHSAGNDRERQWVKRYRTSSPWPQAISRRLGERGTADVSESSTTVETHPTADVTAVTCATPSIFLSFLPPLSHSTSLLRFGHSAPLGSGQAELYACEISTKEQSSEQ